MLEIVETKKALKKVGIAIAELLIDFTAISAAVSISFVIASILPKIIPDELLPAAVAAVGAVASLVTLTVADLKKLLWRRGEE